jgi:hypothetical protein
MLGAMDQNVTALERALQLATSGSCSSVQDVKRRLSAEGYSHAQIDGRTIKQQLLTLIRGARDSASG